ncbi:hypothetical protein F5Y06DRAFT_281431 [Hypoxylon sp. FL0890]|nr:hypothetical protein F5Y06DRAFT_281431 [Hypoxylon sp. FL0890]
MPSNGKHTPAPVSLKAANEYYTRVLPTRQKSEERSEAEGELEAHNDPSSDDSPTKLLVLTGEYRIPFRERMQAIRQRVQERAQERRKSGVISDSLDAMTSKTSAPQTPGSRGPTSAPRAPVTPSGSAQAETCPGAPVKPKREFDLRRLSWGSESEDIDDYLFDRYWAEKEDNVLSKKKSADWSNERQRRGITRPDTPSPLRSSFNAEEMAKLSAQLGEFAKKMAWEIDNTEPGDFRKDDNLPGYRGW